VGSAPSPATATAPARPAETLSNQIAQIQSTEATWLAARRARGRLYADLPDSRMVWMSERFPTQVSKIRVAADRVCRHEFDLLGSGPCVPADPTRPGLGDGYRPIDWAVDPIAGLRFPTGFRYSDWNPQMRPGLADIKWPWEIGRCQHWVTLGQAFRLTGDERYAVELIRQHADFMEVCPIAVGVQYVCTMDVAIRALNWALTFELIRGSASLDLPTLRRVYASLFDLGTFIENNLENKYEVTSNHFLSNVVGLYGIGVVFSDLPAGRRWLAEGREWLEQEMRVQVLEDGADYESSIPYHRLVAELFLAGARLAELEGTSLSDAYLRRMRRMIDFLVSVLRPDGLLPQVGDADDGRVHIFTDYGTWRPQDGRHLTGPAACMLNEPSWLAIGGDDGLWEAAWWGADAASVSAEALPASRETPARLFEQAGVAVARHDRTFLLVTNGRVGTNGFGNHKHNDLLSFEFHADGVPLVVDPGSYVYTSDPTARNLFRATEYHNTIRIDVTEQNDLRPDYLFRMFETSSVEHLGFDDTAAYAEYRGRHTGYQRLPEPVVHARTLRLLKNAAALVIVDRLRGAGVHTLDWHFHLAPGIDVEAIDRGEVALVTAGGRWRFRADTDLSIAVADAWYSPSYGVRRPCRALNLTRRADVSIERDYLFAIGPEAWMASSASASSIAVVTTLPARSETRADE
jgi:hypothetical protein